MNSSQYSEKNWYQGGMWRAPQLLPGIQDEIKDESLKEPVSLSDLFFDLVIVTAFTRVGVAIQDRVSKEMRLWTDSLSSVYMDFKIQPLCLLPNSYFQRFHSTHPLSMFSLRVR